ncbi:hypothetical protein N431DRAFT_468874 [Stipitochalara longipes BDJ]|nr:hypothetical protein N431DRAFT_468874 [Stipitochalara longipes BDJ]
MSKNFTLLFPDIVALIRHRVRPLKVWEILHSCTTILAVEVNNFFRHPMHCTKYGQGNHKIDPGTTIFRLSKEAREFTALRELVLFCAVDDNEFVTFLIKGLSKEYDEKCKNLSYFHIWRVPKITLMVYKPDHPSLQTRANVENDLSVMKDMLDDLKLLE